MNDDLEDVSNVNIGIINDGNLLLILKKYLENFNTRLNTQKAKKIDLFDFLTFISEKGVETFEVLAKQPTTYIHSLIKIWLDNSKNKRQIGAEISISTMQRRLSSVMMFFEYLEEAFPELIKHLPKLPKATRSKYKIIHRKSVTNPFTKDEWKTFLDRLDSHCRRLDVNTLIICTMFMGGRRISEMLSLKWGDLDPDNSKVTISPLKKQSDATIEFIECHPMAFTHLTNLKNEYILKDKISVEDDALIFPQINQKHVDSIIKYHSKKAGINKKLSHHSIRTTFITWARKAGIDSHKIKRNTLHKNIAMIDYYDHSGNDNSAIRSMEQAYSPALIKKLELRSE